MRIAVIVVAAGSVLCGCATFVDGSQQYITISTPPAFYSHCVMSRPGENWNVTTPGFVRVEKSSDDLTIRCARPGYQDMVATIPSDVNLWTFGNLATGGVTAAVDAWTGAMFEYPEEFALTMSPGMTAPNAAPAASTYTVPPPPAPPPVSDIAPPEKAPASSTPDGKPLPGTLPDTL